MTDKCQQCGRTFEQIAQHWTGSDCTRPSFTDHQHEVLTGLVLGDVCVTGNTQTKFPLFIVQSVRKEYLEYLSNNTFPLLGNDVRVTRTAEESAENYRTHGESGNANAENYADIYRFQIMTHPELQQYRDWYIAGKKVVPADSTLTPTVLKHYYALKGSYYQENKVASISLANQIENRRKVISILEEIGFKDFKWSRYDERAGNRTYPKIRFGEEGTENLFEYIGGPVPGFEHKWPEQDQ